MWKFWQIALLDIVIIAISYAVFKISLRGELRHRVWEKYMDSFSMFIIWLFVITAGVNFLTYVILNYLRIKEYVNIIAPAVVSIIVGFILASVPKRSVEDEEVSQRK